MTIRDATIRDATIRDATIRVYEDDTLRYDNDNDAA